MWSGKLDQAQIRQRQSTNTLPDRRKKKLTCTHLTLLVIGLIVLFHDCPSCHSLQLQTTQKDNFDDAQGGL